MNTSSDIKIEKPSIIQALLFGFNTIANKPYLMILPVLLDLFLWFGPGWRVDEYIKPLLTNISRLPIETTGDYGRFFEVYQSLWQEILRDLDLAVSLRTFPIGVPSLMVSKSPFINPLGNSPIISLGSSLEILGVWLLFLLVGFTLANVYYRKISSQVINNSSTTDMKAFFRTLLQIILIPFILSIILIFLSIPFFLLVSFLALISTSISGFIIILLGILLIWILMPLIFTPHSIFLFKQNLLSAMMTSISVVRTSMARTAWFILLAFLMIEGLNYLWRMPNPDNWFLVLGIFGHAFIVTAVIAASFYYFLDATKYTQTLMNQKIKVS
jgi:hypothetical protein